ncbi:MAG: hypothetical protein EXS05_07695 [Planctomycetaceae bacterium]|nr:hypothetical protein [Planctomycetaceae bacterium]
MTTRIEVLAGIAGSGKTAQLLDCYRAACRAARQEGRFGTTLWLTPTSRSRHAVLERLCDGTLPVLFSPNVLTFKDFAERVLRAAPEAVTPLSPTMQWMLLRRIVDRLLSEQALPYYAGIAHTAGFLDLVAAFISELKRSETWPELFSEACLQRGERPRDRELARIYHEYQTTLLGRGVYDSEGRFWSACQALKSGHWGPFAGLSLVVVDGFTDFTPTQHDILSLLAEHAGSLWLSLPLEQPLVRSDLFAKSQTVRASLTSGSGVTVTFVEPLPPDSSSVPAAIRHIAQTLFSNPRTLQRAATAGGIEIVAAAGPKGEVNNLAARVKRLLQAETPPDEIVVAVRDLADYHDLIAEAFDAAGIPFKSSAMTPLDRLPLCRAAVGWVQLEVDDWPFRKLLAVLNSGFFRPAWNETNGGRSVRDVARVLRRWNFTGGREQILKRLELACQLFESEIPETDSSNRIERWEVESAWNLLKGLSDATAGLRKSHDLNGWAGILSSLLSELVPSDASASDEDGASSTDDTRERLPAVLFDAARVEEILGGERPTFGRQRFVQELSDLLRQDAFNSRKSETGCVRVVSAEQVRNLDIPYLFLVGLTERSFPRRRSDDCLYSEFDRQELNAQGLALAPHSQRAQEEMLMFYNVVTRARRRLVLSYPVVNPAGEPLSPSPYLAALQDLFEPEALKVEIEEQLDPIPGPERVLSVADARVRGMFDALEENRPELLRAVCQSPGQGATTANLFAAVDMNVRRFHAPGFTNFEGALENADNRDWLSRRFGPDHEFSATQLEAYAHCPFEFFLSQVLEVEPLATTGYETDFGRRGTLVHAVLAQLHREMAPDREMDGPEAVPGSMPLVERFHQLLHEKLGSGPNPSDLEQTLLAIEERLLREWGTAYADQWEQYLAGHPAGYERPLWPASFETAFGRKAARTEAPLADVAPSLPSLIVGSGDRTVQIGGRIDRIDVGQVAGRTMFTVVDYKTGAPRSDTLEEIAAGRALQLALYTLAVIRLKIVDADPVPVQMGYWYIRKQGFEPAIKLRKPAGGKTPVLEAATWETLEQTLDEIVPRLAAAIRAGKFPVDNPDLQCTGYCPFHTGCRVAQIRSLPAGLAKVRPV